MKEAEVKQKEGINQNEHKRSTVTMTNNESYNTTVQMPSLALTAKKEK